MTLPRSLSNSNIQKSQMQVQTLDDKITRFLNNKFRISRSYATKRTYESALKQFEKFLKTSFGLNLIQLLQKIKVSKELDSIEVQMNKFLNGLKIMLVGGHQIKYQMMTLLQD